MPAAPTDPGGVAARSPVGLTVLVGGVGQLFQSDDDVGRLVVDRVRDLAGPGVLVEDLSYGAIPVVHRLQETHPDVLVLVGSRRAGRSPGEVTRRRVTDVGRTADELQGAVQDAGTGYVDLALTLDVVAALHGLPRRTVTVEVEPASTGPGEALSPPVHVAVPRAEAMVRREVVLAPLFDLLESLRPRVPVLVDADGGLQALADLVTALDLLEDRGSWGRTFAEKDRLRLAVADGAASPAMDHGDWGMLWALVEELQRLEQRSVDDMVL